MKSAIITSDGLISLMRVFVSCKPLMSEIMKENQLYLIKTAKDGKDVYFDEYLKNLPQPDPTYQQILDFANDMGIHHINANIVALFFGGEPHFKKILGQLHDPKLNIKNNDFIQRIFFAHILLPVKITQTDPIIEGIYSNSDVEVIIRNLVKIDNVCLRVGDEALIHYASIIQVMPSANLKVLLLKTQLNCVEFMQACRYIKIMDYKNFWNLCDWTEKTVKDRKI